MGHITPFIISHWTSLNKQHSHGRHFERYNQLALTAARVCTMRRLGWYLPPRKLLREDLSKQPNFHEINLSDDKMRYLDDLSGFSRLPPPPPTSSPAAKRMTIFLKAAAAAAIWSPGVSNRAASTIRSIPPVTVMVPDNLGTGGRERSAALVAG
jgi:hypothetical protein